MIKLMLLIFGCLGCKTFTYPPKNSYPDPTPYIEQFYKDCKTHGNKCEKSPNFEVVIVKDLNVLGKKVGGYCEFITHTIYIDYEDWVESSPIQKRILLYHEFGHCALMRFFHTQSEILRKGKQIPKSLMIKDWNRPTDKEFLENQEYYLNELFN